MKNIRIDQSKCVECQKCIAICPAKVLKLAAGKIEIAHPKFCISCGHCAAICLENAISSHPNNRKNPFLVKEIPSDLPDNCVLFHEKRSVREFKNQLLSKNSIEELIQYGEKAPSSKNLRKRLYYVITDKDKINQLEEAVGKIFKKLLFILNPLLLKLVSLGNKKTAVELTNLVRGIKSLIDEQQQGMSPIFRGAPCIICIAAPTHSVQSKDDCLAAQQYMMLYGHTCKIGSCIIGYAQYAHKTVEKILNIPKGYSIYAVTIFGYSKFAYEQEIEYIKKPQVIWR